MKPLHWYLAGALSVMIVYMAVAGMRDPARDELEARADEARAEVLAAQRDEALARADSAAALVVQARLALEDSVARWQEERTLLEVQAMRDEAHHAELLDSLRAREPALADSLASSADRIRAAWSARVRTLEAERDALRTEVSLLTTEVGALRESLNAAGVAATMYRQANEGLRRALRSEARENALLKIGNGVTLTAIAAVLILR